MTSGVYELKFANGDRYIGKSINIETRWKQHFDKFQKGTAAKAMQHAYNTYGTPKGDILCTCHSDHIDILEACYIARHNPELNSDRPADPFPGEDMDWYINNTNLLSCSTLTHMQDLVNLNRGYKDRGEEIEELEQLNDELLRKRSSEEINSAAGARVKALSSSINSLNRELISAREEVYKLKDYITYLEKPWWKKIFG